MKATGIVRRIDDLGRVVIPKEIRRTLHIREGDPLEIYTEKDGEVIFKKYSPMGDLSEFAEQLCESIGKHAGRIAAVTDRDCILTASGGARRELSDKPNSHDLERLMEQRKCYLFAPGATRYRATEQSDAYFLRAAAPILADGDILGSVLILAGSDASGADELDQKLALTAAGFLGRQMES